MFIYLHVCILVCWNVKLIHGMICGTVKKNVSKNKIVTGKELLKAFLLCHCYTVPANMFFCCCCFFYFEASNILFLRSLLKCILFVFRLKDKAEDSWRHSFLGRHVSVIWTSSRLSCNAFIIGRQIHISRMASFWSHSHITILYAIYIYMFNLYSRFFFQMTGRSNLWIWITVHVNSPLQSSITRRLVTHPVLWKRDYTWINMFKPTLLFHKTIAVCTFRTP